jgi:rhodanese-related sulfurtransferase
VESWCLIKNKKNDNFLQLIYFFGIKHSNTSKEVAMLKRVSVLFVILIVSACATQDSTKISESEITVQQVKTRIDSSDNVLLLDVRTAGEYDGALGHIDSAMLIPLGELENRIAELEGYKNIDIIVICRSGNRSGIATQILREKGYRAKNMLGGMLAWNNLLESLKD